MGTARQIGTILALLVLFVSVTDGQRPVLASTRSFSMMPSRMVEFTIVGAPYSCDIEAETTNTTADGTTFTTNRTLRHEYRDSQGRLRTELPVFGDPNLQLVTLWDLVAGYEYVLDSQHKIAHRAPLRSTGVKTPQEAFQYRKSLPPPEGITRDSLGSQTIDGIYTEGARAIRDFPAGAIGNNRPFAIQQEFWVAPDLALRLVETRNDPRFGKTVVRRKKLVRGEQEAALFLAPLDYNIVDETAPYTIIFVRPGHNGSLLPSVNLDVR